MTSHITCTNDKLTSLCNLHYSDRTRRKRNTDAIEKDPTEQMKVLSMVTHGAGVGHIMCQIPQEITEERNEITKREFNKRGSLQLSESLGQRHRSSVYDTKS